MTPTTLLLRSLRTNQQMGNTKCKHSVKKEPAQTQRALLFLYAAAREHRLGAVKLLVVLGIVLEDGGRLKLRAQGSAVALHSIHQLLSTHGVNVAERTAQERREANAKDGADIYDRSNDGKIVGTRQANRAAGPITTQF